MELHRLTPTSLAQAKRLYAGRCAACGESLKHRYRIVHLYGDAFHHDCAFIHRSNIGIRRDGAA